MDLDNLLLVAAGAAATALGGFISAVYRTRGVIREQAIDIAEFVYKQLHLIETRDPSGGPNTQDARRDAAAYVHLMGALITFFIRSIRFAESKKRIRQCPELPAEMQAILNERFTLIRHNNLPQDMPEEVEGSPEEET